MAIVITQFRRALIAMTVAALSAVAAAAEPNNATAVGPSSLPSEASRGDALVPPVKRMAPQMPANVVVPDEKPDEHNHKHKAKKKRH